ncbi:competence protein CoiA [Pedobacter frigoris]|uniref:competence protein CoiA n=1 Tax=Pedobacter frigoris TaxID=2571272 RepID=UPI00293011D9|nr:competence protein CoiA family protein [Pedobacter frigoris]
MHFALNNDELVEAQTGLNGSCRGCGELVIAKCGTVRVHHWAHKSLEMCDKWWETETEWHRSWKNNFPHLWQECFMPDIQTGEKHIADVRTDHGLVIEFQHSHLKPEERTARENFYQNMVWVVNGTRLVHDYPRFLKGQNHILPTSQLGISHISHPDKCLPSAWLNSSVPVLFDFLGTGSVNNHLDSRNPLYCLFPVRFARRATLARIPRSAFIKTTINGEWSVRVDGIMKELLKAKEEWENQENNTERLWQMHKLQMSRSR